MQDVNFIAEDAHHPRELEGAKKIFERAVDYLNLTEDDKFVVHAIQITYK